MVLIISIIIICILVIIWITVYYYAKKKTHAIVENGYQFVLYFLYHVDKLSYYRTSELWLKNKYGSVYEKLQKAKLKWYVRLVGGGEVSLLIDFYETADNFTASYAPYFSMDHYFAFSEFTALSQVSIKMKKIVIKVVDYNSDLKRFVQSQENKDKYLHILEKLDINMELTNERTIHNMEFVKKELLENKDFFDNVLKYPLDNQQRESIVKLEDNCLVISSAGSGKTSTSIAKVKYLLEKRQLLKDEILVLSYNRKTAYEFQERLDIPGLTCKTFHALALDIIGKVEGKRPDVCDSEFLLQCFYTLVKKSDEYKKAITKYFGELASNTKIEHEYEKSKPYYDDRKKYGILAPYGDMKGNPVFTKSEEEKKICTWLSTHGVDFLYEQVYPIDTSNAGHRQYKPDFTIYFKLNGKIYYLFLEHFGIDENGNVPKWFGEGTQGGFWAANKEYNDGIIWKRKLHRDNKTLLLETQSAMFHNRTIWSKLENQLRKAGVPLRELTPKEKYDLLFKRNEAMEGNVMNLFTSFISLMKSNDKTFDSIMNDIENSEENEEFSERCRFLMYEVIKPLYKEYEASLKAKGQMDFTDIILHAAELGDTHKWQTPYSYILVDEFQDISVDRYKFLKSLRKDTPRTKMYCVGDDWQSIYRFSGSDMNLFNDYDSFFGYTEKCKIETTYRFGNPLVNCSSKFILKNPTQVEKKVNPYSPNASTKIQYIGFTRGNEDGNYLTKIKEILDTIPEDESVMLLGRYNYEVKVFPHKCIEESPNSKRSKVIFAGRSMDFMSVHASKGLEADHVIILNCSQDAGGFPSRVSDDPILGYVLSKIDNFEYSEERRLFYVAITRAKKYTHILYNVNMPSVFVTEMMEQENGNLLLCPVCKIGALKCIKDSKARNGNLYKNYVCSNSIAGCRFFWRIFYRDEAEIISSYHQQMDIFFVDEESSYKSQFIDTYVDKNTLF